MAINLEAMRAKLNASKKAICTSTNKKNDFRWRPSEGDQAIRILPTEDETLSKNFTFIIMLAKTLESYVQRKIMVKNARSAISHQNCGVTV